MTRLAPAFLCLAASAFGQSPQFSFAVLTDIQYADQATAGRRDYRKSLAKLQEAVSALNSGPKPSFAIQLGDLIDAKAADLDTILPVFNRLSFDKRHVLGNHDFSMPRETLQRRLGMPAAYYGFEVKGWRFLVLDGMDVSVNPGSRPLHREADTILANLRESHAANANDWNGAIGREQLDWLKTALKDAAARNERVILFSHFPILAEASTPAHLLWNHDEVLSLIESSPVVAAWFNGHDHAGGYARRNGIHHVTFPGMVESGDRNSYSLVDVYQDRIEIRGTGSAPSRSLPLQQTLSLKARGYSVLPEPRTVQLQPRDFIFGPQWRIEGGPPAEASILREELQSRFQLRLGSRGTGGVIRLSIAPGSVATDQAYQLDLAPHAIAIQANAPTGLFYGIETLVQLLKKEAGQLHLPEGRISDWPDLPYRAIYWDDAHHLDRPEYLKQAIRQAAFYKINAFVLKLEGHFQYRSAPAIVEPYALSPAQYRELTEYALRYHVQLAPFLDSPGHIAFILKHPEYARLREYPESNYELCATNPDSYKLLNGMFQDLLDANPGVKYFYLSTDEPYYIGLTNNQQCREMDRARELGSPGKLLAEFLDKAAGYLHDRGRTVVFWGEHPLKPADVPSLPPYLVNGEVNDGPFNTAFKARGIRQTIYVSTQGEERMFPDYSILPASEKLHPGRPGKPRVDDAFAQIAHNPARQDNDVIGSIVAAWADAGLHTETFWLGYAAISAAAWNPAAREAASSFYPIFYGPSAVKMDRVYELMSRQAQFWSDTWDTGPSQARKPILGNSEGMFPKPRPANDQTIPLPPPTGDSTWSRDNARRLQVAAAAMSENRELLELLDQNLRRVEYNRYNLEVFRSIALLCRQNFEMLASLGAIDDLLRKGQRDQARQKALAIREGRNLAFRQAEEVWYKSWYPRVAQANGRRFVHELDDIKDHVPDRTVDLSYLVYRQLQLPFDHWIDQLK